jgi:hypothetical protein
MNSDAAKEILSAYRSRDRDGADPIFHEALNQMESDSELKKWFEEQQDLDQTIREKLASIEPPADLQAKILARIRGEKVRRFALPQVWLAAAACLVVGGIALFYSNRQTGSDRFQEFKSDAMAIVSVEGGPALDLKTPDLSETQTYLRDHQAPRDDVIPTRLQSMETAGCRVFVWKDNPASLTCFRLPGGLLLHLVVIDRKAMGNADIPVGFKSVGDWHVMFQEKGGMLMMWATQAPMEQLKQMVVKAGWEGARGIRRILGVQRVAGVQGGTPRDTHRGGENKI